jgi:glucosamine--fructose-6-phosphate aminotransferase (isomerizing)
MCGIVAYIGNKNCKNILIDGLKRLEYRGYDSAGIGMLTLTGEKKAGDAKNNAPDPGR